MEKIQTYHNTIFTADVIQEAIDLLNALEPDRQEKAEIVLRNVTAGRTQWTHDSDGEFFADYRKPFAEAQFMLRQYGMGLQVWACTRRNEIRTNVEVKASTRSKIESVFNVFERHAAACIVPESLHEKGPQLNPKVFIGHGRSGQWAELKDHLHEKHGYAVEAYEIGARAGHAIRDILADLPVKSSFAILVMTAENEMADGTIHPRLNVVHELGLFQGHLGFSRAIVLLEEGTEDFSNIHGVHQIRYSKGKIKETFGDGLATLRREFSERDFIHTPENRKNSKGLEKV